MNHYRAESKARALAYYEGYVAKLKKAAKPIYIVMGKTYWKNFVIDNISEGVGKRATRINAQLRMYTKKMYYKTLGNRKHFYHYTYTGEKLSNGDFEALRDYLKNPSKHGVLIIEVSDWKAQKTFERYFSHLKKSEDVDYINTNFYRPNFKEMHIRELLDENNISFETPKLKQKAIQNLMQNVDELLDNIWTLIAVQDTDDYISAATYNESIEQYTENSRAKLYDSLAKVNRKKVPYEIIHDFLENGENPTTLLKRIQTHFTYLYQAKYLKSAGILRPNDIESEKMYLYHDGPVTFPEDLDLWELSKVKRDRFLEDCAEVTLREIIQSLLLIEDSFIVRREEKDGEIHYIKYTTKERLMMCIIQIMTRREGLETLLSTN